MDLDDVVPVADHVTSQSRVIDAPPSVVWEELHRLQLTSLPVSLFLSAVRALPVLLSGRGRRGGLDRTFLDVVPVPLLSPNRRRPWCSVARCRPGGCSVARNHPRSTPPGSGTGRNPAG